MLPGKYHQNGGFSMAMLVYRSVSIFFSCMSLPEVRKWWFPKNVFMFITCREDYFFDTYVVF